MGLYVALPLVLFILLLLWVVPVGLWLQAIFSIGGGHVTIFNLIGMRFRRVPPGVIVNGLIAAQAKAETRRAMAVALEQEMKAKVVEAESEVPKAMAHAFREGNLGVLDYYKLDNIASDTSMRQSIAGTGEESKEDTEE